MEVPGLTVRHLVTAMGTGTAAEEGEGDEEEKEEEGDEVAGGREAMFSNRMFSSTTWLPVSWMHPYSIATEEEEAEAGGVKAVMLQRIVTCPVPTMRKWSAVPCTGSVCTYTPVAS